MKKKSPLPCIRKAARACAWLCCIAFNLLALCSCQDRLFNNPADPNAEAGAYEILATIPLQGITPLDITFSGDAIWIVDMASRLVAVNYNSGSILRELQSDRLVSGLCYDGKDLWLAVRDTAQLVKINMVNGALIKVLSLVRGNFGPMDYYQGKLYIADFLSHAILQVDAETGAIEQSIPPPGLSINGLAFDGQFLWLADASQMRIFKLTLTGSIMQVYLAPSRTVAGLCYSEGIFWCGDQDKLFKLRFF